MEICSVCLKECRGGFEVYERSTKEEMHIVIDSTPDRNFNVCDLCNITICFDCSEDWDSGYCNKCLHRVQ
jgi:hypothetical protein